MIEHPMPIDTTKHGTDSERAARVEQDEKVRRVEIMISNVLRAGVTISFLVVFVGIILMFAHHPAYTRDASELGKLTAAGAAFPHTLGEVFSGLSEFQGRSVVMLGLAILIATPVLRVAISILAFAHQHDRTYVLITTAVLILLLASFFLGKVEG